jgi:hypothetical protein
VPKRTLAGLGAPTDISGYNLQNIRGPGGYVQLDDATRTLANTELLPEAKNLICRRLTSADSYHRRESGFLRKLRKRVAQAVAWG